MLQTTISFGAFIGPTIAGVLLQINSKIMIYVLAIMLALVGVIIAKQCDERPVIAKDIVNDGI